jgi:hypothetical protein
MIEIEIKLYHFFHEPWRGKETLASTAAAEDRVKYFCAMKFSTQVLKTLWK